MSPDHVTIQIHMPVLVTSQAHTTWWEAQLSKIVKAQIVKKYEWLEAIEGTWFSSVPPLDNSLLMSQLLKLTRTRYWLHWSS